MSIALPVQVDPHARVECSHLRNGVCAAAADATGVRIVVTPPVCNLTCPKNGGPRGGKPLPDDDGKWAVSMLRYAWGTSMRKVADRYSKPFDVWVPDDIIEPVRDAFAEITKLPWVDGLGLTGSILSKKATHKDIDVVLIVNDVRAYLDALPKLQLPKMIAGLKVDTFARTRRASWFLLLDIDDYTLYRSGVYNLASVDPRITIVDTGDGFGAFRKSPPALTSPGVPENTPHTSHDPAVFGPKMWRELHTKIDATPDWIEGFTRRIPCPACQLHFRQVLDSLPAVYGAGWFDRTHEWHEHVNASIGKPPVSIDDARSLWTGTEFSRIYVISLERTPDRRTAFYDQLPADWRWQRPVWWKATDGELTPPRADWIAGGPAWGCRSSFVGILDRCMADGVDLPVWIHEDDCSYTAGAVARIADAIKRLPAGWELVMPGMHHTSPPEPVADGIVRAVSFDRCHSMIVAPHFLPTLREIWADSNTHTDHTLNAIAAARRFYAMTPVVAYQRAAMSTITCKLEPSRSWDDQVKVWHRTPVDVPVVLLVATRATMEKLTTDRVLHTSYNRDETGTDRMLAQAVRDRDADKVREMLMRYTKPEAAAYDHEVKAALWVADASPDVLAFIRGAVPEAVVMDTAAVALNWKQVFTDAFSEMRFGAAA